MPTEELAYADIAEVAPRIRAREITATQLTEVCLERIDRFDGRINAFITLLADSALAQARQLDAERSKGASRGPLHGIPVAHKDLYYTKGVRTTAGSKILADFVPEHNATFVSKLETVDMVLLGKVGLHEFAGRHQRQSALRSGAQSVGSRSNSRWLERRFGGGAGGRFLPGGYRQRHGGIDPNPRACVWHQRTEADLRPRQLLRGGAAGVVARPPRADGTLDTLIARCC